MEAFRQTEEKEITPLIPSRFIFLNPSDNHLIISFQSQFSTYGILIPFLSEYCPFSSKKSKLLAFCILLAFLCVFSCSVTSDPLQSYGL